MEITSSQQKGNSLPAGMEKIVPMESGFRITLDALDDFLILLVLLSASFAIQFTVGPFTFGLAEPAVLIFILWRFIFPASDEKPSRYARILTIGFWLFLGWAAFLWVLAANWNIRNGWLFGWAFAILFFANVALGPKKDWRRLAVLILLSCIPNLIAGAAQHFLGYGYNPKNLLGWNPQASTIPIIGFFGHPNDFAVYLFWPLVLSIGLFLEEKKMRRWWFMLIALALLIETYWTYSRTDILSVLFLGVGAGLLFLLPNRKYLLAAILISAILSAVALIGVFHFFSWNEINSFSSGRLGLWNQAAAFVWKDPYYLFLGFLAIPAPNHIPWVFSHNIYLRTWIQYGIPGLFLLGSFAIFLLSIGWKNYEGLRSNKIAGALWVGLAGLFLVNGMTNYYFHETYHLVLFMVVLAVWMGLLSRLNLPFRRL